MNSKETDKQPRYRVTFTWRDHYDKSAGIQTITLNVDAENNFKALTAAWEVLAPLQLPEPKEFSANKIDRC